MHLTDSETKEVVHLVDGRYSELLMIADMIRIGHAPPPIRNKKEIIKEDMFRVGKMLINLTEKAHKSGLCACPNGDEEYIMRVRENFGKQFAREIKAEAWTERNLGILRVQNPNISPKAEE